MMEGKHRKKKMEEPNERSLYGKMEDNSPERNSLSDYGTMRTKPGDQKRMNLTLPSNGNNIPFVIPTSRRSISSQETNLDAGDDFVLAMDSSDDNQKKYDDTLRIGDEKKKKY